jgi:hypothetical protein
MRWNTKAARPAHRLGTAMGSPLRAAREADTLPRMRSGDRRLRAPRARGSRNTRALSGSPLRAAHEADTLRECVVGIAVCERRAQRGSRNTRALSGSPLRAAREAGAPARDRTWDRRFRKAMLYPTELRAPAAHHSAASAGLQMVPVPSSHPMTRRPRGRPRQRNQPIPQFREIPPAPHSRIALQALSFLPLRTPWSPSLVPDGTEAPW